MPLQDLLEGKEEQNEESVINVHTTSEEQVTGVDICIIQDGVKHTDNVGTAGRALRC